MKKEEGGQLKASANLRVRLSFNEQVVFVTLHDTPSCRDLLRMLPLTLTLTDYAVTEKIATLPRKLSLDGAPKGHDPSIGELAYYAPWGNIAFFYKDAPYAKGLVPLGVVESGLEKLAGLHDEVSVRIEPVIGR